MVQLLYIVASLHILLCPFTKVEESFNIQATHDIIFHRFNLSQYDHNEFPGVVPRTFIGPVVISALSSPVVTILHFAGINKFWMQYVVRLTLALTVIASWSRFRDALRKQFGNNFAWWFTILSVTQYHFMFYMSRPLPNILALPFVLLALEGWLLGKQKQFIISAGTSIIVFRSELAMLFGLLLIIDIYFKKMDLMGFVKIALPAGVGLIALTVIVDSIFWGRPLWPEAEVFWYNTILNKSSNWGTSPFLWYFYSALPRGLGPSIVLLPVGLYLERRIVPIVAPAIVYVLLFSFLPHKELRFIIYVFPMLNTALAAVCSYVFLRRTKSPVFELLFWGICVIIIANVVFCISLVLVAMANYPGGLAITKFHKLLKNEQFVHVHISNLAAQTGVTRFTQIHDHWIYSKNESLQPEQMQEYSHLLIEAKSKYSPTMKSFMQTHVVLESIETFSHISVNYKLMPPVKIKTRPALFILEKLTFRENPVGSNAPVQSSETAEIESNEIYDESFNIQDKNSNGKADINLSSTEIDDTNALDNFIIENISNDETEASNGLSKNYEENQANDKSKIEDENSVQKSKKPMNELKSYRQERKKKAMAKIKQETRKEVVASAKEKLREIMKRHKQLAEELTDTVLTDMKTEVYAEVERGDIPDTVTVDEEAAEEITDKNEQNKTPVDTRKNEENSTIDTEILTESEDMSSQANENLDAIVEEVIVRLIDRKIYDHKTKPEDIKVEDRQVIQKIVEEVLAEKMIYKSNTENKVEQ